MLKINQSREAKLAHQVKVQIIHAITNLQDLEEMVGPKCSRGETYRHFAQELFNFLSTDHGEAGYEAFLKQEVLK